MRIREEYDYITKTTGRPVNNLSQFNDNKQSIIDTKLKFVELFGYNPSIKECVYIIENNLERPDKCANPECKNIAKFNKNSYKYCSRYCSDVDVRRNEKIQKSRTGKIDYTEVHKKVVNTKSIVGVDGLNVHQRTGLKVMRARNENYDSWYEKTVEANKNKSLEVKKISNEKRLKTIFTKYNQTHFGGGYSKLKRIIIQDKLFVFQGYEDVALYELLYERGYKVDDIECCVRCNKHKFKYEYGYYYPDLYIKSEGKYLEIKSEYWNNRDTYKDLKESSVLLSGYKFERIIYVNKDKVKEARKFFTETNCYCKE